ncbi:MAG TPA: transcription termination/antitermination NusG family protein, partial [Mycobacterium sp.]|nr:transcription termination/antitermination NusG family protein [Mycobacterium sp.]
EKLGGGRIQKVEESLFPGYLFIQLDAQSNWAPLRSTRGVSRLVVFSGYPLPVPAGLILAGCVLSRYPWRSVDGYVGHSAGVQLLALISVALLAASVLPYSPRAARQ